MKLEKDDDKKEDQPKMVNVSAAMQPPKPVVQQKKAAGGGFLSSIFNAFSKSDAKVPEMKDDSNSDQELNMQRNLSDIEMDADDLSGDLGLSDDENDGERKRGMLKIQKAEKRAKRASKPMMVKKKKQVFRQEFDTNVFEVALSCLEHKGKIATGDAEICQKCKAVFNQYSVL